MNSYWEECPSPPQNFYWVVEGQLAGMAFPETESNIKFLLDQGIRHLVSLLPEKKPPVCCFPDMLWTQIPIIEFAAPSIEQINEFISICERHITKCEAVGIHCRQGKGRTGVMAACFLIRFRNLPPERAIAQVRSLQPGSVESREQEGVVEMYFDFVHET